ncbi:MAG: RNA methyltransferase [Pseudomonadota bacterium]
MDESQKPAIILVTPQMGENIGAAARVMANFGLSDLRLTAPRDGWPNAAAETMSAGALKRHVNVQVFETLEAAIADLSFVLATTARPRGMEKPVYNAADGINSIRQTLGRTGVLFGAEKSGLPNDAVARAAGILTYPVNSSFSSLNLAQAVAVFAHAWAASDASTPDVFLSDEAPASGAELSGMLEHFEAELDAAGFFFPPEKRSVMVRNLTNAFTRAGWTSQEVRTFRGAVKALAVGRGKARTYR